MRETVREFPGTSACEVAALECVRGGPGDHLTGQEKVIVRVPGQRPQGWECEALLDELSKGRREPFTSMALAVHLCHLRKKGYSVKCRDIYTLDDAPCLVLPRKGRASAFPLNEHRES